MSGLCASDVEDSPDDISVLTFLPTSSKFLVFSFSMASATCAAKVVDDEDDNGNETAGVFELVGLVIEDPYGPLNFREEE